MSATDGFSAYIAAPAVAALRRRHPGLSVEIVTVTRRALQHRSGLDIEVAVGEPQVHRAQVIRVGEYVLGMYASRDYLAEHGTPSTGQELTRHPLVYLSTRFPPPTCGSRRRLRPPPAGSSPSGHPPGPCRPRLRADGPVSR